MAVKFSPKRISNGRDWCGVHYGTGPYVSLPAGTITVYCKGTIFPASIRKVMASNLENNSDMMTDYFEADKLRILPGSPYHAEAAKAAEAA